VPPGKNLDNDAPQLLTCALKAQTGDDSARYVFTLAQWRLEAATDSCLSITFATRDGFEVSFCMTLQACRELARRYAHTSQVLKGSCLVPLGGSSQTSHPKPMPSKFHVEAFAAKSTPRTLPQSAAPPEAPRRGTDRVGVDRTLLAVTSRCRPFSLDRGMADRRATAVRSVGGFNDSVAAERKRICPKPATWRMAQ
ncbi:MAG TPA: hypothetical protein VEK55_17815, partial [Xanthobacteraceae bacterium]|nr:hypothetical protein [Xanthobacteraceae bacterium]